MLTTPVVLIEPFGKHFCISVTLNGHVEGRIERLTDLFVYSDTEYHYELVNGRFPVFRVTCGDSTDIEHVLEHVLAIDENSIIVSAQGQAFGDVPAGTLAVMIKGQYLAGVR